MQEGQFTIEVPPRFVTAYRDNSWVPIDVVVNNNRRDVSGFVQVSLSTGAGQLSPLYAIPAESPKASRKRFRVYCNLSGAAEIEAGVYLKRWRSVELPVKIVLRPIAPEDLLVLVVDDDAPSYGFLYNALQQGGSVRPVHRIEVRSHELDLLPEHFSCYEAYDAIILGKTDPAAITAEQRALIERYVMEGGVLIVCTGEFGSRYQGTWVEELAGVRVSGQTTLQEKALAETSLPPDQQAGARSDKQVVLTQLLPQLPEVTVRGTNPVLATRRPLGGGYVAVFGVDAAGRALQECKGYLSIWQELCEWRPRTPRPNINAALQYFTQVMPGVVGVRIVPRSTVILFLGLYILVGVIGNWVFWSLLKRREMAWVCLVIFSFGFTGYALVFGTAGRAKSTEMHEVGVVRMPLHGATAHLSTVTGILSARSSEYTFDLAHPNSLVTESFSINNFNGMGGSPFGGTLRPSRFVRSQPPRLEDFQVGASVFRVCNVEADITLAGGIQGVLTADENGLNGTLTNSTGWPIESASILYKGNLISLDGAGPEWRVQTTTEVYRQPTPLLSNDPYRYARGFSGAPRRSPNHIQTPILRALLEDVHAPGLLNSELPPLFCGWSSRADVPGILVTEDLRRASQQTLVLSEIDVVYKGLQQTSSTVLEEDKSRLTISEQQATQRARSRQIVVGEGFYNAIPLYLNRPHPLDLRVPSVFQDTQDAVVYIDLYWQSSGGRVIYSLLGASSDWSSTHTAQTRAISSEVNPLSLTTYRIDDWRKDYDPKNQVLTGNVQIVLERSSGEMNAWGNFLAVGRIEAPAQAKHKEWTPWQ